MSQTFLYFCLYSPGKTTFVFILPRTLNKAMEGACQLKQTFRDSPAVAEILKMGVDAGITEEQALMDVLFMLK